MAAEMESRERLTAAAAAVTETLFDRGYRLDCVLGARLLTSLLAELGIESEAVGTVFRVADPVATDTLLSSGSVLQVGGQPRELPGAFNGHVVVCATIDADRHLLDPTIGQLYDNDVTRSIGEDLLVLVTRLREPWSSRERKVVELPINGWTLIYEHVPTMNWTGQVGGTIHTMSPYCRRHARSTSGGQTSTESGAVERSLGRNGDPVETRRAPAEVGGSSSSAVGND